jgi:hypothetical protein
VFASAQEGQRLPGPGSGIIKTEIVNTPEVEARQHGEWAVSIANVPDVRVVHVPAVSVAPPEFMRKGGRYEVTWPGGERQQIVVAQVAAGGWIKIDADARERWVNLSAARAVDELPR